MPAGERRSLDLLIAAALALAIGFAVAATVVTYLSVSRFTHAIADVDRGRELSETLLGLFSHLQDVEIGARGFAITGKDEMLQSYRTALEPIEKDLARLRLLEADDDSLRQRVDRLERLTADRIAVAESVVRARIEEGEQASLEVVRSDRGKRLMDAIRSEILTMQDVQRAAQEARQMRATQAATRTWWAFGILAAMVMALLGGLVHLVRREISLRERARADLERLVAERTAELSLVNAELRRSETMAALGALVGGVAHQVRNPLFSISATLDALEARLSPRDETCRHFEVMRAELTRLNDLMQELLEYGRPSSAEIAPGSMAGVIEEALRYCQPLATHHGVRLPKSPPPDVAPVAMDRARLIVLFENLLTNAIQMGERGGHVEVGLTETQGDGRRWVECAVRDDGPGFREDEIRQAFEPFFSRRKGGTGLGLAIAQRCAEQHGGNVRVANRPGRGAEVTVRLPAFEERAAPS